MIIGYYNASGRVIAADAGIGSVLSGSEKTSHTFTIPEAVRGNFTAAKVFLWEDINSITPYTQFIEAE